MSLSVHALASGSSGNATLVKYAKAGGQAAVLIDAGISVRALVNHLAVHSLLLCDLSAIILTHEHSDHAMSAHAVARKFGVPLVANRETLGKVLHAKKDAPSCELPTQGTWEDGGLLVQTFPVPHDAIDPVGISLTFDGVKVCMATDLGYVTPYVLDAMKGAHLLILEANHDVYRLQTGRYPPSLKQRILSRTGHLSNEDSVRAMVTHVFDHGPCCIWLAHLSKENNTPKLALGYARETIKSAVKNPVLLQVAARDKPSVSWTPYATAVQLPLL
jgi:phosphoribosyl 1,2-cyclic phosphodiesterase